MSERTGDTRKVVSGAEIFAAWKALPARQRALAVAAMAMAMSPDDDGVELLTVNDRAGAGARLVGIVAIAKNEMAAKLLKAAEGVMPKSR